MYYAGGVGGSTEDTAGIYRLDDDGATKLVSHGGSLLKRKGIVALRASPSGKFLAYAVYGNIRVPMGPPLRNEVWVLDTETMKRTRVQVLDLAIAMVWDPTGTNLYVVGRLQGEEGIWRIAMKE